MYTKGTFVPTDNVPQSYEPNFVMSVRIESTKEVGVCFFDISTSKCFLGQFTDDINYAAFRTLISQVNPVEMVVERDEIPI